MTTAAGTTARGPVVSASARAAIAYTARRTGVTVGTILLSLLVLVVLWQIAISTSNISSFITKGPLDVWKYFTQDGDGGTAASHQRTLFRLLGVTLQDASIGFLVGVPLSALIAVLFTMFRPIEFMFMPIAMLLRTVPLLAMAPVIYIIFGNGAVTAALIGTVVVLFPLLVNITVGLRSVSQQSVDLVRVYGGSRFTVLRKVAVPTALPHFFASMRIAVPGAITGAMLYEYLFTSAGLGGTVVTAKAAFDYQLIWASTVFVTVVSVVFYTITAIIEAAVLSEWGPDAGKSTGR
ncbi:ABC transporter permease [Amnibacterium kyonggiense]|uniref:ABC-type nitrate/sulfonate/bicarbonate transport system permease component n=1 Tax=Amnibacterium kyonggiense TaxID=595671 RepID=A0A4R7FGP6_9MICO|nr:ABC transporter permease subunit [Amnibacterium kyonggiense]TDS76160.1 ABC-type nitrate/sulfonate/bicarbonate transport system permease component [Amnibacterium kyonggiense]